MSKTTSAFKALESFIDSVDKIGAKHTIKVLQEGKSSRNEQTKLFVNFIMTQTCKSYNITLVELLELRTLNDRTEALAICYYLCEKLMNLKQAEIKIYFTNTKFISQISRGIKRIRELDLKIPNDRKIKDKLMIIEDICQKFIESKQVK